MKVALAQMEVIPNRPKKNLETMLAMIKDAKEMNVDLIAFPELAISGYLLGDNWTSESFCTSLMEFNEKIMLASEGIAIAYGNIFVDSEIKGRLKETVFHPNEDGRIRKYNAVYVFQNGRPVERARETLVLPKGIQPKTLLPNYRIFDDKRYFHSTIQVAQDFGVKLEELLQPFLIEVRGKKIPVGFEVCEDLWCEDYRRNKAPLNPTKILIDNGACYVINISASPWTVGKNQARDRRVEFLKKESDKDFVPFYYVNCIGMQNNGKNLVMFDGGSTVYNRAGLPVKLSSSSYLQELIIAEDKDLKISPIIREEKPAIAQKYDSIIEGIRRVRYMVGSDTHPHVVLGLSGGIDSSLVAALLVEAIGKDNVLGVNMPHIYNSQKTKDAAQHVANKLGITYAISPIESLVNETQKVLNSVDPWNSGTKMTDFQMENVQARIRGAGILAGLSAKYGAIFTNNGNKLEVALGYATLYGDVGGAFSPIADLTKTEVVAMSKYYNDVIAKSEVIPRILFPDNLWRFGEDQILPTAELKNKQVDPMKFGYHCALINMMTDYKKMNGIDIMRLYSAGNLHKYIDTFLSSIGIDSNGYALMKRWGVDKPDEFIKDLEWFEKTVSGAVFKRVQSPPIIITSKSAYGYDIRESVLPYERLAEFERLKDKILSSGEYRPQGDLK